MSVVVLVPGYGGWGRFVERWRMGVARRTLEVHGGGRLVLSGHRGEAERLQALAPSDASIVLETEARTTLENVQLSLPSLTGFDRVAVASDWAHRRRAERTLARLDPALAQRLVAPAYVQPAALLMGLGGVAYETARLLRRSVDRSR